MKQRPQAIRIVERTKWEITAQTLWDWGWLVVWGAGILAVLFGAIR